MVEYILLKRCLRRTKQYISVGSLLAHLIVGTNRFGYVDEVLLRDVVVTDIIDNNIRWWNAHLIK